MIGKVDHIGIAVHSIEEARKLYEALGLHVEHIEEVPDEGVRVARGRFGARMSVALRNEGPVTLLLDTRGEF